MKLLAIDSATDKLALAAVEWSGVAGAAPRVEALDVAGGAAASNLAVPGLLDLLARQGWQIADLDAIAFGCGPGGFTGLRTACSVAQGLAWGAGIPVLPIDSLMLVADDACARHPPACLPGARVWVAMDARMNEIYAACYECQPEGGWQVIVAPQLTHAGALQVLFDADPPALVAGSALAAFGDALRPGMALVVPDELSRAHALARLAVRAFSRGAAVPAAQGLPVYLRDKVAQTTEERARAKAAKVAAA